MPNMNNILRTETVADQTVQLRRKSNGRLVLLSFGSLGITVQPFSSSITEENAIRQFGASVTGLTAYTYGGQHYE